MEQDEKVWRKGDKAVWRGQLVTVDAHAGQLPVRLEGCGDVVLAWKVDLNEVPSAQ